MERSGKNGKMVEEQEVSKGNRSKDSRELKGKSRW